MTDTAFLKHSCCAILHGDRPSPGWQVEVLLPWSSLSWLWSCSPGYPSPGCGAAALFIPWLRCCFPGHPLTVVLLPWSSRGLRCRCPGHPVSVVLLPWSSPGWGAAALVIPWLWYYCFLFHPLTVFLLPWSSRGWGAAILVILVCDVGVLDIPTLWGLCTYSSGCGASWRKL